MDNGNTNVERPLKTDRDKDYT